MRALTLVNVSVDHLVDFLSQLLCDFSLLGFQHLTHYTHDVLPTCGPSIGGIKVMQSDVLHQLLALVHITLSMDSNRGTEASTIRYIQ